MTVYIGGASGGYDARWIVVMVGSHADGRNKNIVDDEFAVVGLMAPEIFEDARLTMLSIRRLMFGEVDYEQSKLKDSESRRLTLMYTYLFVIYRLCAIQDAVPGSGMLRAAEDYRNLRLVHCFSLQWGQAC